MEQDECKKLLPLVNPKLYKSTMNKERQKQREEEKAEKEQQESPSFVTVESPIEVKAEPVINEIPEPKVDSEILLDVKAQLTDIQPKSEPNQISIIVLEELDKENPATPEIQAPTQ